MVEVEGVDFVSVLTQDISRAKQFYGETLGLPIETEGENDLEFTLGQVTLDVFDPSSIGQEFAPSPAGIAIRVPDVGDEILTVGLGIPEGERDVRALHLAGGVVARRQAEHVPIEGDRLAHVSSGNGYEVDLLDAHFS